MKTKLSLRERRFIDSYIENGGNATQAFLTASPLYKGKQARKLGSRMWARVDISLIEILDEIGLTDLVLSHKLLAGLSATRETGKGFQKTEVTDYSTIVKYIDIALKLKGKYPSEKHDINIKGETIIKVKLPKEENGDNS